jgi:hypothetical protein
MATVETYSFYLDSFQIYNTRSWHEDTNTVGFGIAIGGMPEQLQTRFIGDCNNGVFWVGLSFNSIPVYDDSIVVLSYSIQNIAEGGDRAVRQVADVVGRMLSAGLQSAATAVANGVLVGTTAGAAADVLALEVGSILGLSVATPVLGPAIGLAVGAAALKGWGMLFADCDGPVATAMHIFTGGDIKRMLDGKSAVSISEDNPGLDSPHGCGSNSQYRTTWSIVRGVRRTRPSREPRQPTPPRGPAGGNRPVER